MIQISSAVLGLVIICSFIGGMALAGFLAFKFTRRIMSYLVIVPDKENNIEDDISLSELERAIIRALEEKEEEDNGKDKHDKQ